MNRFEIHEKVLYDLAQDLEWTTCVVRLIKFKPLKLEGCKKTKAFYIITLRQFIAAIIN